MFFELLNKFVLSLAKAERWMVGTSAICKRDLGRNSNISSISIPHPYPPRDLFRILELHVDIYLALSNQPLWMASALLCAILWFVLHPKAAVETSTPPSIFSHYSLQNCLAHRCYFSPKPDSSFPVSSEVPSSLKSSTSSGAFLALAFSTLMSSRLTWCLLISHSEWLLTTLGGEGRSRLPSVWKSPNLGNLLLFTQFHHPCLGLLIISTLCSPLRYSRTHWWKPLFDTTYCSISKFIFAWHPNLESL